MKQTLIHPLLNPPSNPLSDLQSPSMSNPEEDLDLLLSLDEEKVLETPPGSPTPHRVDPDDDDGSPKIKKPRSNNMSVFRDSVKEYLDANPTDAEPAITSKPSKSVRSNEVGIEKYSGLRIKKQLVSGMELNNRFSEIRFVRLSVIKNLINGDTLSGCWATVGVLTEKGAVKMSSSGKEYCVWKMSSLDEITVSVFLFGDAYTKNCSEKVGSVFAMFNSAVRKDAVNGFSLSVYNSSNTLKIGTSADYGVCKGKRKDGEACTMIINRRQGAYCKYHSSKSSHTQRYTTSRAELKGGNIRMPYRFQSEGIYAVDPMVNESKLKKPGQPIRVLSVDGLKRVLSKAEAVTTNSQSQGMRFLSRVTADGAPKPASKPTTKYNHTRTSSGIRSSSATNAASNVPRDKKLPEAKRKKTDNGSVNMIELDVVSSDED